VSDFQPGLHPPANADRAEHIHVIGAKVWSAERPVDADWGRHFLGVLDGVPLWAVDVPHGDDPSDGAAVDLYSLHARTDALNWGIAGRAVQIVEWARTHRFCGRCAEPNVAVAGERAMRCPRCGLMSFPRLAPAMITLVTRGEGVGQQALLAQGVQFRGPMYSCLAGFVEPGESLEQAVRREVMEEVSIKVDRVDYVASQPWPFPHSLMIGFRAEYAAGEINCDPSEIVDANWYCRDELPTIPPAMSIARRLIDDWVNEA